MKKNLFYRANMTRRNVLLDAIFNAFLRICSYPRLVLEVFLRHNMGERYFGLASAITVGIILFLIPMFQLLIPSGRFGSGPSLGSVIGNNVLWYAFVAAYGFFARLRYLEVKREPSVFDFARFSLSDGYLLPPFRNSGFNIRVQEIWLEPLAAFIAGMVLLPIGQTMLGWLFIFCAIVYSVSKAAAYSKGDHFIMDRIDEMICNEDLKRALVDNEESKRGMRFRARFPTKRELREQLAEEMIEEEEHAPEVL
ncbi:MAG: hypothetical protein IPK70_09980 [Flavobacteriales bacterium]|jgi:hypothetical protein|nr:hypothetical protein [Flavobacteriales bacterium]